MPARPHGSFAWNEIATADVGRAKEFYEATLGWTFQQFDLPSGPYWMIMSGEQMVGGLGRPAQGQALVRGFAHALNRR